MVIECHICAYPYDRDSRKPVIGACGHTLCFSCRAGLNTSSYNCPTCQNCGSFSSETTNFQLLDCLEKVDEIKNGHVSDVADLRQEVDSLKTSRDEMDKQREEKAAAVEELRKELENRNTDITELKKKVEQSIADEEMYKDSRWSCSECKFDMEQLRGRICLQCCEESGAVGMDDGVIKIKDVEKADASILCASCFLEGTHKGHHSTSFLKIKLRDRAAKEFDLSAADILKVGDVEMKEICNSLNESSGRFVPLMQQLRDKVVSQRTVPDFEGLMEEGDEISKAVTDAAGQLKEHAVQYVAKLARLERKLLAVINDEPMIEEKDEAMEETGVNAVEN